MADVVDLSEHRKPSDPELIDSLRVLLSHAQNGRMVALVAYWVADDNSAEAVYHGSSNFEAIGMASALQADLLANTFEE